MMSIPYTVRPTRELPLFFLAILLVASVCMPIWYWATNTPEDQGLTERWTPERIGRLLIGPEQVACYICFAWAWLILFSRKREVWRQRRAFALDLLPTDEGARILPEDARPLARKVEQLTGRKGPYILSNMVRMALGKYAISRSGPDVGEVVRMQAEVEQGRLVTSMATIQFLAWAIPAIGFLGTVRGLAGGMTMASVKNDSLAVADFIKQATDQLAIAFDCTFVALALTLVLMYFLHSVQRDEEMLVIDCQQYCQQNLLLRLYDPQPEPAYAD